MQLMSELAAQGSLVFTSNALAVPLPPRETYAIKREPEVAASASCLELVPLLALIGLCEYLRLKDGLGSELVSLVPPSI